MTRPTAKPNTIEITAAKMTMPKVRKICSLTWPDASNRTSATTICEGGITTLGLITPVWQHTSSKPNAAATTASLIQATLLMAFGSYGGHPGVAERLHRLAAEVVPQPSRDLAEGRLADDLAVALARPACNDD